MLTVGLTGGIGSGKSTVSKMFRQRDVTVVDADQIAHQLVTPGQQTLQDIIHCFGDQMLTPSGLLDRAALRDLVFQDPHQKQLLESILHPRVYEEIASQLDAGKSAYGIADIPLLIETRSQDKVDRILVIDCSETIQRQRVRERSQLDNAEIERIMRSQCTREERLSWATDVILNESDLSSLERQVEQHHKLFLALASAVD